MGLVQWAGTLGGFGLRASGSKLRATADLRQACEIDRTIGREAAIDEGRLDERERREADPRPPLEEREAHAQDCGRGGRRSPQRGERPAAGPRRASGFCSAAGRHTARDGDAVEPERRQPADVAERHLDQRRPPLVYRERVVVQPQVDDDSVWVGEPVGGHLVDSRRALAHFYARVLDLEPRRQVVIEQQQHDVQPRSRVELVEERVDVVVVEEPLHFAARAGGRPTRHLIVARPTRHLIVARPVLRRAAAQTQICQQVRGARCHHQDEPSREWRVHVCEDEVDRAAGEQPD
eukprot:2566829-Prymnesium_polylepis.3